jgi:hypothetical protein
MTARLEPARDAARVRVLRLNALARAATALRTTRKTSHRLRWAEYPPGRVTNSPARRRRPEWTARGEGSYLLSIGDAQAVLDAAHSGNARILGTTKAGHVVVEVKSVTGFNNNPGAGFLDQPTNVFMIKGTTSPSVVPTSPAWKPASPP